MQITEDSVGGQKVVFEHIISEVAGGAALNVARLDNTKHTANVDKRYIKAGAPVYFVPSTRVAELCKSAIAIDGGSGTEIRVGKNHHFKVNDYLNDGTTGALITAIDESNAAYDTVTVNTALTYAANTKYVEGTASGTSTALKYTPNGVVKSDEFIGEGNAAVSVVTMATVREAGLTYPIPTLYKTALRAATGTSLITLE